MLAPHQQHAPAQPVAQRAVAAWSDSDGMGGRRLFYSEWFGLDWTDIDANLDELADLALHAASAACAAVFNREDLHVLNVRLHPIVISEREIRTEHGDGRLGRRRSRSSIR